LGRGGEGRGLGLDSKGMGGFRSGIPEGEDRESFT